MDKTELITSMTTELRRGTLILIVLSQLFDKQYGYSLLQKLEKQGVYMDASSLYPMLRRLEKQGVLKSEWDTSVSRPRKYYLLGEDGTVIYRELLKEWQKMNEEMNFLRGEEHG